MFRNWRHDDCDGDIVFYCSVVLFVDVLLLAESIFFLCQEANPPTIGFTALFSVGFVVMLFLTFHAVRQWRKQVNDQP